jgi:hypothetical protein
MVLGAMNFKAPIKVVWMLAPIAAVTAATVSYAATPKQAAKLKARERPITNERCSQI